MFENCAFQYQKMPRYRDNPPAVRVYTVCDESRYLLVRNVPSLGCGDELLKLFSTYGEVQECKPMDAEDCEPFTDVYWIQFQLYSNARFAKRKLDDCVFLGNKLQVSYAPQFETPSDTKDKLEARRREILARLHPRRSKETTASNSAANSSVTSPSWTNSVPQQMSSNQRNFAPLGKSAYNYVQPMERVSSDKDYFPSQSMNQTVKLVREKLDKIQSSAEHLQAGPASKKPRVDNRRRI